MTLINEQDTGRGILLIQPKEVDSDLLVNRPSLPLSLLSISTLLHKDFSIQISDQRLPGDWRADILRALKMNPVVVGVTCLTGYQIKYALEVSEFVRSHSAVPIIWGGIHSEIQIRHALQMNYIDGVVAREGEVTFSETVRSLATGRSPAGIDGLWWKENGEVTFSGPRPFLDFEKLPDLPYHLVDLEHYIRYRAPGSSIMFESSRGCPNNCSFCSCSHYSNKWRPLSAQLVVERIERLVKQFSVRTVVIVDDNFFVSIKRARDIFQGIRDKDLSVSLDIQGAHLNSIQRMTDEDLTDMQAAGVKKINVGVESGSDRVLEMIRKGIKVDQVLEQNRRFSRFDFRVQYNFITGYPTETRQELQQTISLALQLLRENPRAMLNYFCVFTPMPDTKLYQTELERGVNLPQSIQDWAKFDRIYINQRQEGHLQNVSIPLNFLSLFADRKVDYYVSSKIVQFLSALYRPFARLRMQNLRFGFLIEKRLFDFLNKRRFATGKARD